MGKVLLINHGSALMANRLASLLAEAKIETDIAQPSVRAMELAKYGVDALVLFTGNFIYSEEVKEFLAYLKDICLPTEMPLYAAGYDKELAKLEADFPKELIKREFIRPFDINDLAAELQTLFDVEIDFKAKKSILLVDDDVSFLQMMQGWLGAKYRLAAVGSGKQAIEYLLAGYSADLVLLDYDMPDMTGPQVLATLRHNPKISRIPVMFLTGKNDRNSVMTVVNLKPDGYILKSMSRDEILSSVKRFFSAKKA